MSDDQRDLARNARTVQNLQLWLLLGVILGGIAGIVLAAYVILPQTNNYLVALVAIPVCAFVGQRIVLSFLAR